MSDCCNHEPKHDECCHDVPCCEGRSQADFFGWWRSKAETSAVTFTLAEVLDILELVKEFNAGAVDPYLSRHVDKVMCEKMEEKKQ